MLGRTDSRRRLLVVLVAFMVVGAALVAGSVWWQVVQHDHSPAGPAPDDGPVRAPSAAARSTTGPGRSSSRRRSTATWWPRRRTRSRRRATRQSRARPGRDPRSGPGCRACAVRQDRDDKPTWSSPAGSRTRSPSRSARRSPRAAEGDPIEPESVRVYPQAGGAAGTTLAAHLLGFVNRDGEGQYGVEERYQAELAGPPRAALAERDVVGRPVTDTAAGPEPGRGRADLRLTIDTDLQLARTGGPGGLHCRRGGQRVGRRDGPLDRGDLRLGELSVATTRTTTGRSPPRTRSVRRPGRVVGLRARLGVQDVDGHGGPRAGTINARRRILDSGIPLASTTARRRIYDADQRATAT